MFTFKKESKPSGLARVTHQSSIDIKVSKKVCGHIIPPLNIGGATGEKWRVQIAIKKDDSWEWIFLKKQFESAIDAQEWLKEKYDKITEKYALHLFEE